MVAALRRTVAALLACLACAATLAATAEPDLSTLDHTVRAQDDFYRHANGTWLSHATLPPGAVTRTIGDELSERADDRLRALLENGGHAAPTSAEARAGAMYAAFIDEPARESLGAKPVLDELALIRAARTRAELAALMGRSHGALGGSLYALGVDVDIGHPDRYAVYVGQSGLTLPERDYYTLPEHASARNAYRAYVERLLTLVGWRDPGTTAGAVLALETRLAEASWSKAAQQDLRRLYNPMSAAELAVLAPDFDWNAFLASAGLADEPRLVVAERSAFPKLARVYAQAPLATLQAWLAFMVADSVAPYLSSDFVQAHFDFHHRTLAGERSLPPVWKQGLVAVAGGDCTSEPRSCFGTLRWLAGEAYVAHEFSGDARERAQALTVSLVASLRQRLARLDWMSPATRVEAVRKLDSIQLKVGYPEHWPDTGVAVSRDDLVGDVRRAAQSDWTLQLARRHAPVDRRAWPVTPQTVDVYRGELRDLVLPAALLQPPLFDPGADDAVNYGRAGAAIAHELIHLVDEEGRWLDADGERRDWWTAADAAAYHARTAALAAQHAAILVADGVHGDGLRSTVEDAADLGGLEVALDAYHASRHGHPAPVIDGLTGDQRFFLAYAQGLRALVTEPFLRQQVATGTRSPGLARVTGSLPNCDGFASAFAVRQGDRMYLAPGDRVHLW